MLIFLDIKNKIFYIASPKCGNHTIAKHLEIYIHTPIVNENNYLSDSEYKKIIIVRNVLDRFYSGFCEDLTNNTCYEDINITFYEYILFLKYCFDNKLKNVTNLNAFYENLDVPIWWGNCSNIYLPITNSNGIIDGHIKSQHDSINSYVNIIISTSNCNNVEITDIKQLKFNNVNIEHEKKYTSNSFNFESKLSDIKKYVKLNNCYPKKENMYNSEIISIINHIYKKDYEFIDSLYNTFTPLHI
jgi:hypothetical protein